MKIIGKRVVLTRKESINHFLPYRSIIGTVIKHDPDYKEGIHSRPFLIKFDDGRESWYARNEFREIRK